MRKGFTSRSAGGILRSPLEPRSSSGQEQTCGGVGRGYFSCHENTPCSPDSPHTDFGVAADVGYFSDETGGIPSGRGSNPLSGVACSRLKILLWRQSAATSLGENGVRFPGSEAKAAATQSSFVPSNRFDVAIDRGYFSTLNRTPGVARPGVSPVACSHQGFGVAVEDCFIASRWSVVRVHPAARAVVAVAQRQSIGGGNSVTVLACSHQKFCRGGRGRILRLVSGWSLVRFQPGLVPVAQLVRAPSPERDIPDLACSRQLVWRGARARLLPGSSPGRGAARCSRPRSCIRVRPLSALACSRQLKSSSCST